jgi:hypothetical protein
MLGAGARRSTIVKKNTALILALLGTLVALVAAHRS